MLTKKHALRWFGILLAMLALLSLATAVSAQGDEVDPEDYPSTFPAGTIIEGIIDAVDSDGGITTVTINGVVYFLSSEVDAGAFIVGEPISVTVVLGEDYTMTIIAVGEEPVDAEWVDPNVEHPVGTAIAEAMNVPYENVMTWSEHNLGFGEIARAYLLAYEAGVDVWEILSLRVDTGANWGDLMQAYDVHPSLLGLGRIMSGRFVLDDDLLALLPGDVDPSGLLDGVDLNTWDEDAAAAAAAGEGSEGEEGGETTDGEEEEDEEEGEGEASSPGDHGCPRPGNYCNAPGWQSVFGE